MVYYGIWEGKHGKHFATLKEYSSGHFPGYYL